MRSSTRCLKRPGGRMRERIKRQQAFVASSPDARGVPFESPSRLAVAGSNQGPAITEIDSPHLRGGGRVIGEPAPILPGDSHQAGTCGTSVGTDVRIWWESGNGTGFPRSQHPGPVWPQSDPL